MSTADTLRGMIIPGLYHLRCELGVLKPSSVLVNRTRYLTGFVLLRRKTDGGAGEPRYTRLLPHYPDLVERLVSERLGPFRGRPDHLRRRPW